MAVGFGNEIHRNSVFKKGLVLAALFGGANPASAFPATRKTPGHDADESNERAHG
jgi:hypothetical protein